MTSRKTTPRRRRFTTAAEDAAFIFGRMADARLAVGAAVRSFRNGRDVPATTIASFDGDIAILADGTDGHRSNLIAADRRPGSSVRTGVK
jgi:hypothetical protein